MAKAMQIMVIADDLTGACATGAMLLPCGRVRVELTYPLTNPPATADVETKAYAGTTAGAEAADVRILCTDTREAAPEDAYRRIRAAAAALGSRRLLVLGKRIDSTLRGNIGAELRAVLDACGLRAIVVPAAPASGRTTVDGVQRVHGVPVAETEAGRDPRRPVRMSSVPALLAEQTGLTVGLVPLHVVRRGPDAIRRACATIFARIIVADAETDADIAVVAQAWMHESILAADPGPFTAALARCRFGATSLLLPPTNAARVPAERSLAARALHPPERAGRVLVLAGSPTSPASAQVRLLETAFPGMFTVLDAARAADPSHVDAATRQVVGRLRDAAVAGVRPAPAESPSRDPLVAEAMAAIAAAVLAELPPGGARSGIVATGGQVATGVCRRLDAQGVEVIREIFPLCAAGRLLGGAHAGTMIATKGGMVGNGDALIACVRALRGGEDEFPAP